MLQCRPGWLTDSPSYALSVRAICPVEPDHVAVTIKQSDRIRRGRKNPEDFVAGASNQQLAGGRDLSRHPTDISDRFALTDVDCIEGNLEGITSIDQNVFA